MNKRIVNGLLLFAMMFAGIARVPVIVSGAQNDIAADVLLASGSGIPQTAESNGNSWHPSVSSDGRFIAFTSEATNLVENDTNGKPDIFVHDKDTDTTFMVSVNSSFEYARYTAVSDGSDYPLISADGKYVTFGSDAYNLGGTNGNSCTEIYRHGIFTGITELVTKSVKSDPECDISFAHMGYPTSISANGQYIVFQSKRLDLVPDEQVDNSWDTYVRDMVNNTTTKLSQDPRIGSYNYAGWKGNISGDGNLVSYEELLSNIAYTYDVKLYNRTNGETKSILELMGLVPRGVYLASHAHLSADGRYLSFYYSCYTDTACLGVDYDEGYYIFDIESSTFIRVNFPDILVINTESISADANYLSYYVTDSGWGVNTA